ncbi:MAG: hypothetical protein EAZ24_15845 [Burkholderiales bacterium]|nr:MAG: hypothetical protein EAZ24_15845 [Burkholderiales bacterium]
MGTDCSVHRRVRYGAPNVFQTLIWNSDRQVKPNWEGACLALDSASRSGQEDADQIALLVISSAFGATDSV